MHQPYLEVARSRGGLQALSAHFSQKR